MPKPDSLIAAQLEQARAEQEARKLFQGSRDVQFITNKVEEKAIKVGGNIHFLPVSTERDPTGPFQSAGVDPLDGDILDPEFVLDPTKVDLDTLLNFDCQIEHEPPQQLLKLYGVDEQREVAFWLPFSTLKRSGLVDSWRIHGAEQGDLILWDDTWYQAWNVYRDKYHGQRSEAHYILCFCDRYRTNSQDPEDVADECPEEDEY